ncbi:oxidase [Lithospermum erythrorhizon]|uniref:Protoporphyrinogen oxidase n=1 Tax=Lithospermum erythrorhizon TaxID=34254 RepID=A0AAV3NGM7_LITER
MTSSFILHHPSASLHGGATTLLTPNLSKKSNSHHSILKRTTRRVQCSVANQPTKPPSPTTPQPPLDCVIVGGGISGLCIAQTLTSKNPQLNLMLTESKEKLGGNINTVTKDGYLWEEGPNSFQPSEAMLKMILDVGLENDLVLGDPNDPRFVLWEGKLRPVPSKLSDLLVFDLMSLGGKIRAGFGAIGFRPPPPGREESVEEFVRRNLGNEVFERLIEPFCSGVYAGDPSKLSMKAAFGKVWKLEQGGGSIVGGAIKAIREKSSSPKTPRDPRLPKPKGQTVGSFTKGLSMLPNAISSRLGAKVKVSWKLIGISKSGSGEYVLTYETPEGTVNLESKSIVMTIPSYVAGSLLRPLSDTAADALSKFYYPPVAAVTVSYPKEAIRQECLIDGELKGFGQLHPRTQGVETLGTIYSSSLFPNRAPPGRILLLNYIGGATNVGIMSKTESQLVESVDRDLRTMLIKTNAQDPVLMGLRVWPQAIPQFLVGHFDILESAKSALNAGGYKGLFLSGNYVSGVALGRCVEGAYEVAEEVDNFLSQSVYR